MERKTHKTWGGGLERELAGKSETYVRHVANPGNIGRTKDPNSMEAACGDLRGICRLPNGTPLIEMQIQDISSRMPETVFHGRIIPAYKLYTLKGDGQSVAVTYSQIKEDELGIFKHVNGYGAANLLGYGDGQVILGKLMQSVPGKFFIYQGEKTRQEISKDIGKMAPKIDQGFKLNSILYWTR